MCAMYRKKQECKQKNTISDNSRSCLIPVMKEAANDIFKVYLITNLNTLGTLQLRLSTELREGAQPLSCHHVLGVGHEYLKPSASHPTVVLLCFAYSSANKYPIAHAIYIPVFQRLLKTSPFFHEFPFVHCKYLQDGYMQ